MYFAALITTILAIIILWILQPVEKIFSDRFKLKSIKVVTVDRNKSIEIVNKTFQSNNLEISACLIDKMDEEFIISFKFKSLSKPQLQILINDFQTDPGVKEVVWNN